MYAASLIFYLIGSGFLILAGVGFFIVWDDRSADSTPTCGAALVSLLISAGAFAVADMLWRAA